MVLQKAENLCRQTRPVKPDARFHAPTSRTWDRPKAPYMFGLAGKFKPLRPYLGVAHTHRRNVRMREHTNEWSWWFARP